MATPTKKSPGIEKFITHQLGGTSRTDAIKKDKCALCGKSAKKFKDTASAREYRISGMCQKCQDKVFEGSLHESIAQMIDEELHERGLCNECILCRMKELGQTFGLQPNKQKELAKLISAKPTERDKLLTIARFGKDVLGFRGDRLKQFAYAAKNVLLGGR